MGEGGSFCDLYWNYKWTAHGFCDRISITGRFYGRFLLR